MASPCSCKKAKCKTANCGKCPRCGCECDGRTIAIKMGNQRGKHLPPKTPSPVRTPSRAAAKDAREAIAQQTTEEMDVDKPLTAPLTANDAVAGYKSVREALGWLGFSDDTYRSLPSTVMRNNPSLHTSDPAGFRRMARACSKVFAGFARMLHPGNPARLIMVAYGGAIRMVKSAPGEQDEHELDDELHELEQEAGGGDNGGGGDGGDDGDDGGDDEMTLADLVRARNSRRAGARAEQQPRARKRKRGERDGSGSGSEESASSDGAGSAEESIGESAAESDADAEEEATGLVFGAYGPGDADCAAKRLTGVRVMKRSTYGHIRGPRRKAQPGGVAAPAAGANAGADGAARRKDVVAEGVRMVQERLEASKFVRAGKEEMPEYNLAANTAVKALKGGWARRPGWGKAYGEAYIKHYQLDIKRFFNSGAANSSVKMNPAMMLDELRKRYPGRYSLPGENEIRTLIGTLFSQDKKQRGAPAQEEDGRGGGGEHDGAGGDGAPGPRKRGRKTKLPLDYQTFFDALLEECPATKPADALSKLKVRFPGELVDDT
jgi:hypothetical protein